MTWYKSKLGFSSSLGMFVYLSWASFSIGSVPQLHITLATFLGLPSETQHKDVLKRTSASSGFSPPWRRDTLTDPQWYLTGLFSFGSDAPRHGLIGDKELARVA